MSRAWPPQTLSHDVEGVIDECERMELAAVPVTQTAHIPIIQLAALLFIGDYINARHVWRRWRGNCRTEEEMKALADWTALGHAMMNNNAKEVWAVLPQIHEAAPPPFNQYAVEVGDAFRRRVLIQYGAPALTSEPFISMMNFADADHAQKFAAQNRQRLEAEAARRVLTSADGNTDINEVIGVLETTPLALPSFQVQRASTMML
mmetsp:Transcript_20036/g.55737  ORF Transcript_20036/g.55737 Transcript_20036/m.55737 type:complete len:205 (-) Transcript_20036:1224-1838(-)|eukprot:CAMPEP_0198134162 /NCGR_PEP_ID=MMETSP1442-20131203/59935_1 /TAXON_ID= /ORGANISM="Craspedostauros australis, Strain CCMP3328" /LENGTH=204 /DNA_ID=CAMNT_0043795303 /DNA_START=566 /DNA_END=1180 /DNA_ORIENTATION=+